MQCAALLKRHIPNFDLNSLEEIAAREGVEVDSADPATVLYYGPNGSPDPNNRG